MTIRLNTKAGSATVALLMFLLFCLAGCSGKRAVVKPPSSGEDNPKARPCLRVFWTNDQSLMARVMAGLGEGKGFVPLVREAVEQNPAAAGDRLVCLNKRDMKPALAGLAADLDPGQVMGPVELDNGQALVMATSRSHFLRARELTRAKQWDEARQELDADLQLNPDNVSSWWLLSLARLETGDKKGALEAAEKGLAWRPQNAPLLNAKGAALAGLGKRDEAIASYRLALEYEPGDALTMNNLAWALTEKGVEPDTALSLAGEAVRQKPDRPEFWDTLGRAHQKKGQYLQAASAYLHALKLDKGDQKLERKLLDCLVKLDPKQVEGLLAEPGKEKPLVSSTGQKKQAAKAQPGTIAKPAPRAKAEPVQKSPIPSVALEGKTLSYAGASPKPAAPATEKAAPAKPEPARASGHYVQVASFRAKALAIKSREYWRRRGFNCHFTLMDLGRRGKWYRVLLGPYPSRNKASHVALELRRKKAITSYRLVSLP